MARTQSKVFNLCGEVASSTLSIGSLKMTIPHPRRMILTTKKITVNILVISGYDKDFMNKMPHSRNIVLHRRIITAVRKLNLLIHSTAK